VKVRQENQQTREPAAGFSEYLRVLWRKRYFVLIPLALSGVISIVGVRFLKPVYMSSSVILMEDKSYLNEEVASLVSVEERRAAIDEETLLKLTGQVTSSVFLDELIDQLGLSSNPAVIAAAERDRDEKYPHVSTAELVRRRLRSLISHKIEVTLTGPGMFRIACYDYDTEACYKLADAVANLIVETNQRKRLEGLKRASEFSDEQLRIYKTRLEESEARLEELQGRITKLAVESNLVGESSRYGEEVGGESNLRAAETLKEQLDIRVNELDAVVSRTRERLVGLVGRVPDDDRMRSDPEVRKIALNLNSLRETQLRLSLASRGGRSEDLTRNEQAVELAESNLRRRLAVVADAAFPDVDADLRPLTVEYHLQRAILRSYESQRSRLVAYIDSFKQKLDVTPQLESQVEKLTEEVKTNRELYQTFLKAKTSAQVSEAAESTNLGPTIEIMERASRPLVPVKPDKTNIILLALIFGGAIGAAGIVVSEYADASFRTVEDIETVLELKVLGAVPLVDGRARWDQVKEKRQRWIWVGAAIVVVIGSLAGFYVYGRVAEKQAIQVDTTQPIRE
jgi:uncharacterized protein involved in exopolysaccharide biosynthesis